MLSCPVTLPLAQTLLTAPPDWVVPTRPPTAPVPITLPLAQASAIRLPLPLWKPTRPPTNSVPETSAAEYTWAMTPKLSPTNVPTHPPPDTLPPRTPTLRITPPEL